MTIENICAAIPSTIRFTNRCGAEAGRMIVSATGIVWFVVVDTGDGVEVVWSPTC